MKRLSDWRRDELPGGHKAADQPLVRPDLQPSRHCCCYCCCCCNFEVERWNSSIARSCTHPQPRPAYRKRHTIRMIGPEVNTQPDLIREGSTGRWQDPRWVSSDFDETRPGCRWQGRPRRRRSDTECRGCLRAVEQTRVRFRDQDPVLNIWWFWK